MRNCITSRIYINDPDFYVEIKIPVDIYNKLTKEDFGKIHKFLCDIYEV